jgi:hypothetical protein
MKGFRTRSTAIGVATVIVAGCASVISVSAVGGQSARAQQVVVTRNGGRGPSSCRPDAIGERLVQFTRALRTKDLDALRDVWNRPFEWFYVGLPRGRAIDARSPREALAQMRRRDGLPLRLSEVDVDFDRSWGYPAVDMEYGGWWGPKQRPVHGKGFMLCNRPAIRVWGAAVGRKHRPHRFGEICPAPPAQTDPRSMVVCTRRH